VKLKPEKSGQKPIKDELFKVSQNVYMQQIEFSKDVYEQPDDLTVSIITPDKREAEKSGTLKLYWPLPILESATYQAGEPPTVEIKAASGQPMKGVTIIKVVKKNGTEDDIYLGRIVNVSNEKISVKLTEGFNFEDGPWQVQVNNRDGEPEDSKPVDLQKPSSDSVEKDKKRDN
jgi:hypothetical protein